MENGTKNAIVLIITLLGSIGAIIAAVPSFDALLTPPVIGAFLLAIASNLGSAYGVTPKAKE